MSDASSKQHVTETYLSVLSTELQALRASSERLLFGIESLFPVSAAVVASGLAVGVGQDNPAVMAVIPPTLFILFTFALGRIGEALVRGGQLRWLEQYANSLSDAPPIFLGEGWVAPIQHGHHRLGRLDVLLSQLVIFLALLVTGVYGAVWSLEQSTVVGISYLFVTITTMIACALAFLHMSSCYEAGYIAARSAHCPGAAPRNSPMMPTDERLR